MHPCRFIGSTPLIQAMTTGESIHASSYLLSLLDLCLAMRTNTGCQIIKIRLENSIGIALVRVRYIAHRPLPFYWYPSERYPVQWTNFVTTMLLTKEGHRRERKQGKPESSNPSSFTSHSYPTTIPACCQHPKVLRA